MRIIHIDDIEYGWLTLLVDNHALTCSNVMENDDPAALLEGLARIVTGKTKEAWCAWAGEPDAVILRLAVDGHEVTISAWESLRDSFDLPEAEAELPACRGELLWEAALDGPECVDAAVSAFALYENGNGRALYNAHWGDFPQGPFDALKAFALGLSRAREARNPDAGLYCASFLEA